ncbi:uncharacterized protein NEMAJ01_0611 [Nematocida major]|uniref:uncharacterized protein n=1 Tax=Nematocida major TaxID=1912982 RepID=UPI002008D653|nr:uncharacterized protein NEMAJ01_0611 [Nematocida major]KAH9385715.1 hypothetical protein NEMAJ01_0611 [Nematocida major]
MGIERAIEVLQETDSPADIRRFVENKLGAVIDYIFLISSTSSQKTSRLNTLDFIKGSIFQKSIAPKLCTEKYIFGLRSIRKNAHSKKVSDGIVSLCYEIYADGMKILLECMPEKTLEIIAGHPSMCYIEQLLKSSEYSPIIEMFPCFFSLGESNFCRWIRLLVAKDAISMLLRSLEKLTRAQKGAHNLAKFLYLFVSFTGNVFKDSAHMEATGYHYTHFYSQIEERAEPLLSCIFSGSDSINRLACLEVVREMIRTVEYLPSGKHTLRFLHVYLEGSSVLKSLESSDHTAPATVCILYLINTVSRTVRYKHADMLEFLKKTRFLHHVAVYLHGTSTHSITNEVCLLLNELVYVDKAFYIDLIVEFSRSVKDHTFKKVVQTYAVSQQRHNPHVSVIDCITPVVYILYKLYHMCMYECTKRSKEARQQSTRFVVVDETKEMYKLLQALEFLQDEQAYWYITTRIFEHEKRISLEYGRSLPDRHPNAEQFARYFCDYTASVLPAYPPWLLQ